MDNEIHEEDSDSTINEASGPCQVINIPRIYNDDAGISLNPSYSKFKLNYEVVCRQRYHQKKRLYEKQFLKELKMLETLQPSAYEALRFNRHFCITTLWPPLHTKKEIQNVLREFYKLPPKQQERLNYLLKEDQI